MIKKLLVVLWMCGLFVGCTPTPAPLSGTQALKTAVAVVSKATQGQTSVLGIGKKPASLDVGSWQPLLIIPSAVLPTAEAIAGKKFSLPLTVKDWKLLANKGLHPSVLWWSPDRHMLAPYLLTDAGVSLNTKVLVVSDILVPPATALEKASDSKGAMLFGSSGPILTAFIDPDCSWCHRLFMESRPDIANGKFRLRVVLVGVLGNDSVARAVSILAAPSPSKAFIANEANFDVAHEQGAAALATKDGSAWGQWYPQVKSNTDLMTSAGSHGTPTLLFCNRRSGRVMEQSGYVSPATLLGWLGTKGSIDCSK